LSLDVGHPGSKEVMKKLIQWADIIGESMAPGSMVRLGLDYESVKKIKPDIIYFSSCQFGQQGSLSKWRGYGPQGSTLGGFANILGEPDLSPVMPSNAHSDFTACPYLSCFLILALLRKRRTGEGTYIDFSQQETAINFMGPFILDYTVNGRVLGRMGNKDPYMAPHGSYLCRGKNHWGEGRYVVIAVPNDEVWQCFCHVLGNPDWTSKAEFATAVNRKKNEAEMDKLIEAWTTQFTPEQIMTMMQAVGVPCGVMEYAEDVVADPQLKHRGQIKYVKHPEIGDMPLTTPSYRLSRTPFNITRAGPCIGEHNEYILKDLLKLNDDDIAELLTSGALTTEADVKA
ncbi:MAG: CoA transferase, partial [Dehalococcoidales bacterium]|nr:CoA transferase [Dehalococcoidales bacterium]